MHRLSNMELHSPRLAWLLTFLSAQSASSRDQNWVPHMAPCPGVISLITGWFHLFSLWKGQHLFLVKYTYFGYGSSLPAYHTSAKTIIHGLKNALSTFMVFTQHYFWSKEFTLWKWSAAMGPCSWNLLVLPCTRHPEAARLKNGGLASWSLWYSTS